MAVSNCQRSVFFRNAAAEAGDLWAQFQLAQRCRNLRGNLSEAKMWYLEAAKQNHTAAMLQLGALLHDGDRWFGYVWVCLGMFGYVCLVLLILALDCFCC